MLDVTVRDVVDDDDDDDGDESVEAVDAVAMTRDSNARDATSVERMPPPTTTTTMTTTMCAPSVSYTHLTLPTICSV